MARRDVEALVVQLETRLNVYEREMAKARAKTEATTAAIERRFDRMANNVAQRMRGTIGSAMNTIGASSLGAAAGIGGFAYALGQSLRRIAEAEVLMNRLEGVLRVTGNTTGMTAKEIDTFGKQIERSTGTAATEVLSAATALSTYSTITGEEFRRTIAVANDMAAVFGGNLRENVDRVARALDDPINGFAALRRQGFALTDAQLELVESMIAVGDHAGAMRLVLKSLEQQVGGAAGANNTGLTGAINDATNAVGELIDAMVEATGVGGLLTAVLNGIAGGARDLADGLAPPTLGEQLDEINRKIVELYEARQALTGYSSVAHDLGFAEGDLAKIETELAQLEADQRAILDRMAGEAAKAAERAATAEAARVERINEGLTATGKDLEKQFQSVETAAERIARLQGELEERVEQQRQIVANGGDAALAETNIKLLEELYARQIAAVRAREASDAKRAGAKGDRDEERQRAALDRLADEIRLNDELIARFAEGETVIARLRADFEALAEARRLGLEPGSEDFDQFTAEKARLFMQERLLELKREGMGLTAALRTEEEMRNDELARLNELLAAGAISQETYQRGLINLAEKYAEQNTLMESLAQVGERAFDRIGGAITEAFAKGEISAVNFEQIVNAILAELMQEMIKMAILNPLQGLLFGAGGMGGGGLLGGLISAIGSLFGGGGGGGPTYASMPGRGVAAGGPVSAGRLYEVGEHGRELFVPSKGGTVIPHRLAAEMARPPAIIIPALAQPRGGEGGRGDVTVNVTTDPDLRVRTERSSDGQGERIDVIVDRVVSQKLSTPGSKSYRTMEQNGVRPRLPRR